MWLYVLLYTSIYSIKTFHIMEDDQHIFLQLLPERV